MATLVAIRQRIYDYLYGAFPTESPFVTRLNASYSSGASSITVLDGNQWAPNDTLENIETGEQFKVISVSGNVLTVINAWNGSTAAASVGTDDVLFKNPRFTQTQVNNAITNTLSSLVNWGIHVYGNGTITRADPKEFYELTETDISPTYGVLKIYEVDPNYEHPRALPFKWHYQLGIAPTEYTSTGSGVRILSWGASTTNGEAVYFIYAKLIDSVTDLLVRQEEVVVAGASALLLGGTIAPATHDPGARTDRTVAPGQTSRDVRFFQGRFFTEARAEAALLTTERDNMLSEVPKLARARRWVG